MKNLILSFLGLTVLISALSIQAQSISVANYQWKPYVNESGQTLGTTAELLSQIVSQDDIDINWRYQNYDLAFELIAQGKQQAGFRTLKLANEQSEYCFLMPFFFSN